MMKCPAKVVLIDGDILLYRFAFSNQRSIEWDEDTTSEILNLPLACYAADQFIQGIILETKTDRCIVCLTGSLNFRYKVLPSYKGNRANLEKPVLLDGIREHFLLNYPTRLKEGIEADDTMGILSTRTPNKYIIASADKDMATIPGWLFDWKDRSLRLVTEAEADKMFYTQVLTGDTSDGYKGIPGIGPKKAEKILKKPYWKSIREAYIAAGLTEADAIVQAQVARILRAEDYDFEKKEVILWTPKSSHKT
jgi:DNA polymerase-1